LVDRKIDEKKAEQPTLVLPIVWLDIESISSSNSFVLQFGLDE
jgi:hypothetical protein